MKPLPRVLAGSLLAVFCLAATGCFDSAPWNTPALQLWKTDGTSAGAAFVRRLPMRLEWNWLEPVALGDQVLFTLTDGSQGVELWRSDGSVDGTVKVLDLSPGKAEVGGVGPVPDAVLAVGKTLFFTFADGVHGPELWKTDGTEAGTGLVKDILPGSAGSFPRQFARLGHRLLFFVEAEPTALWSSDGTAEGTVQLAPVPWSLGTSAVVGDALFYRAGGSSDETNALWRSDGTPGGTMRIGDFPAGPADCVAARSLLFCDVLDELWTSDETGNTRRIAAIQGIRSDSLIGAGQRVYFATATAGKDHQLWTSDGSAEGTLAVASFPDLGEQTFGGGFARGEPTDLTPLGDVLYFAGHRPETGYELWRSDGTVAGTRLVVDLEPGPTDSFPSSLRALGGRLIFRATRGLWSTDGTEAGTILVQADDHNPELTVAGDWAYWLIRP
jgi:ELWxxDGT repeat protein